MSTYLLKCVPPHLSTLHAGGEALFEEECSEDEVAEELAPLTVQLGYVLARLGRLTEAQEMYEQVWGSGKVCVCRQQYGCSWRQPRLQHRTASPPHFKGFTSYHNM